MIPNCHHRCWRYSCVGCDMRVWAGTRFWAFLLAVTAIFAGWPLRGEAIAASSEAQSINRDVLGLYDGATEPTVEFSRLHRHLEMPLNHLGYKLTLHDIRKGLPDPAQVRRYRAVATWFRRRSPVPTGP